MKGHARRANMSTKELVDLIVSALTIAGLFILTSYLFGTFEPELKRFIGTNSLAGMILFVLFFAVSIVVVPVSAMPLIPIGAKLWGIGLTTALSTAGWTLGAVIAFTISRKYGRPFVEKFISLDKIERIESFIPKRHVFLTIFFFRMFTPFDGLSYVLGLLTQVNIGVFFWSTLLGLIPFCFAVSFLGTLSTSFLTLGLVLACAFFAIVIYHVKANQRPWWRRLK